MTTGVKAPGWLISLVSASVVLIGLGVKMERMRAANTENITVNAERIDRLEKWLFKVDSSLNYHLTWASSESRELRRLIESEHKLRCLDNRTPRQWLQIAGIDCGALLGNKVPNQ